MRQGTDGRRQPASRQRSYSALERTSVVEAHDAAAASAGDSAARRPVPAKAVTICSSCRGSTLRN